jgi:hypothetical protein
MLVLADVWEEHEANVGCQACDGGQVKMRTNTGLIYGTCAVCQGTGYVSNGNSLRAEALRLLGECGKVGDAKVAYHWMEGGQCYLQSGECVACDRSGVVPESWWDVAYHTESHDAVNARLGLMDAYAAADQPTRERWARETWALVPGVECPVCNPWDSRYEPYRDGEDRCHACHWAGRIPTPQEATR